MHKDIAVKLQNISKVYKLYDKPIDRLKESLHPLKKKYHKDFYALKNINFEIKKGEVLGIVGVNGAGKSTLLKIIAGVLTPSSGRITINGKINAILELSSGLKPEMTGIQNIKLNLQINSINENIEELTKEIIEFADIGEHINQPIKTYSSGMKARLGFGLATSTDPDILIVDEVLAVGDVLFRRKCYSRIERLFQDGKTVIFVSHSAQSVIEFCSSAILLYDREIILEDTPKKVTDFYQKLVFSKNKEKTLNELEMKKEFKEKETISNPFFLPNLVSNVMSIYDDSQLEIYDVCIKTKNNKIINVLVHGEKYFYCYKLKFKSNLKEVAFGMNIKTEKGFNITTTGSLNFDMLIESANINEIYAIEWEFICFLTAGIYYTNAGATYNHNGTREILNRIIDAYTFKVLPFQKKINGVVSLQQSPKFKLISSSINEHL